MGLAPFWHVGGCVSGPVGHRHGSSHVLGDDSGFTVGQDSEISFSGLGLLRESDNDEPDMSADAGSQTVDFQVDADDNDWLSSQRRRRSCLSESLPSLAWRKLAVKGLESGLRDEIPGCGYGARVN